MKENRFDRNAATCLFKRRLRPDNVSQEFLRFVGTRPGNQFVPFGHRVTCHSFYGPRDSLPGRSGPWKSCDRTHERFRRWIYRSGVSTLIVCGRVVPHTTFVTATIISLIYWIYLKEFSCYSLMTPYCASLQNQCTQLWYSNNNYIKNYEGFYHPFVALFDLISSSLVTKCS